MPDIHNSTLMNCQQVKELKGAAHDIGPPMTYAHKKIPDKKTSEVSASLLKQRLM